MINNFSTRLFLCFLFVGIGIFEHINIVVFKENLSNFLSLFFALFFIYYFYHSRSSFIFNQSRLKKFILFSFFSVLIIIFSLIFNHFFNLNSNYQLSTNLVYPLKHSFGYYIRQREIPTFNIIDFDNYKFIIKFIIWLIPLFLIYVLRFFDDKEFLLVWKLYSYIFIFLFFLEMLLVLLSGNSLSNILLPSNPFRLREILTIPAIYFPILEPSNYPYVIFPMLIIAIYENNKTLIGIFFIMLLFSTSTRAFLLILLLLFFFFFSIFNNSNKNFNSKLYIPVIAVVLCVCFFYHYEKFFYSIECNSFCVRISLFINNLQLLFQNLFFGLGLAATHAFNGFFGIALQIGLIGFLFIIKFLIDFFELTVNKLTIVFILFLLFSFSNNILYSFLILNYLYLIQIIQKERIYDKSHHHY